MSSEAKNAGIGLIIFIVIMAAFAIYDSYFHQTKTPTYTEQPKQKSSQSIDSERQDVIESENYNPNSNGGEQCWGVICN